MIVDHLYVIPVLAALDGSGDKKLETLRTAKALFARHGSKGKTAALIQISKLWKGDQFESEVIETLGEVEKIGKSEEGSKEEKKEDKKETPVIQPSVGIYLVFHSDGGGMVLMPEAIAGMLTTVIPQTLHAGIKKISLFACDVADRGEGDPIDKVIGLTMEEVRRKVTLIGGLQIMVLLLSELAKRGIRPMICGYDIPIFAGEGPYKNLKPARGLKVRADDQWKPADYAQEDVYGRKLVIYQNNRQSLSPLKSRDLAEPGYKNLHKKVLRLNNEGKIVEALAGWSSTD